MVRAQKQTIEGGIVWFVLWIPFGFLNHANSLRFLKSVTSVINSSVSLLSLVQITLFLFGLVF